MAQGAGASDPEPRALRGAATAPRVTSGPRGRAQAEADRARTPPGGLSSCRIVGSIGKSCARVGNGSTGRQRPAPPRAPPADGGGPRPGPGGQGALPRPHRGVRARGSPQRGPSGTPPCSRLPSPLRLDAFRHRAGSARCVRIPSTAEHFWKESLRSTVAVGDAPRAIRRPRRHLGTRPRPRPARAQLRPARRQPHSPPVCATPPRAPHVWKSLRACPRDWLAPPSAVLLGPHVPQRVRAALVVRTGAPTSALARGTGR